MDISDWRKKIDEVDATILNLLNLRADMAIEIGKLKSRDGLGLRTPTREREIVERMLSLNPGPLDAEAIEKIYETIVNQCIRAQERSQSGDSDQPSRDDAPPKAKQGTKKKATSAGKAKKARK